MGVCIEKLKGLFLYRHGKLYWVSQDGTRNTPDRVAGSLNTSTGYLVVRSKKLDKLYTQVHNIVWELHHGGIPKGNVVDHIDRCRTNNDISNLRLCTKIENLWNRSSCKGRKYDLPRGVRFDKRLVNNPYYIDFMKDGVNYRERGFSNLEDATKAAEALSKQLYGEFHSGGEYGKVCI